MNVNGLSQKKALEIIKHIQNKDDTEFIKTSQAQKIYKDIINKILEFTNTDYARNRILLLTPTTDKNTIQETNKLIQNTLNETKDLDYDYIRQLYQNIEPLNDKIQPKFNDEYAIICEDYEDYLNLIKKGFDRYSSIYPIENQMNLNEYDFIIYLYSDFLKEPGEANNIITISNNSEDYEIQPAILLEYYRQNLKTLENIKELREYLNMDTCIPEIIEALNSIHTETKDLKNLEEIIEDIKDIANKEIKEEIKKIDLSGDEILLLLDNENMPPKIMSIFNTVLTKANEEILNQTQLNFDPFIVKYPLEIDYEEIKRIKETEIASIHIKKYEQEIVACSILEKYQKEIQKESKEIIEYDYPFTLASFSKYYNLNIAKIGNEYKLNNALHLTLAQEEKITNEEMQKINYHLDKNNNIILLTGANSGGKTTLLETLAQHTLMAYMGLGVCSQKSTIPPINEVYYFTKKQSLNAGAFETFLTSFIPVTVGDSKKLILIDELESITELEAAIKIIIGFIEHLQNKDTYAIIVTHMAPEILKHTSNVKIRTDGIEAKGLDENYNLIVDRTPKIDYLANSTPELILKKIYEQSEEPIKGIYKDILDKF